VLCTVRLCGSFCEAHPLLMSTFVSFSCSQNMCLTVHCSTDLCEQHNSTCHDKFACKQTIQSWVAAAALSLVRLLAAQ